MASPPYDLARLAVHDAAAYRRFPGPDFYEALGWIHEAVEPETYVEIGVLGGCSLAAVRPRTVAVGIDPAPLEDDSRIFRLTSAEFFARHNLRQVLGGEPVAFGLIDGLRLFEQALEDLCNLERYSGRDTVIALHNTIPLDRETSARRRTTEFYTGDVEGDSVSGTASAGARADHGGGGAEWTDPDPRAGPRAGQCLTPHGCLAIRRA